MVGSRGVNGSRDGRESGGEEGLGWGPLDQFLTALVPRFPTEILFVRQSKQ